MSLTFGAVNSDRVRCGSAAALDDLSTLSAIAWVYPTTLTAGSRIVTKDSGVGTAGWFWNLRGTAGAFGMSGLFSTTNASSQSSDGYLTTNTWHCVGTSWDRGGAAAPKLYHGTLSALIAETTYASQATPVGSYLSDAAVELTIGNTGAASPTSAFAGRLAVVALFNRVLAVGEFRAWQFAPRVLSGCIGYWRLGDTGTGTQPDLSGNGNAGTVTGATQSANPPLRRWRRGLQVVPYAVTAASGKRPLWLR